MIDISLTVDELLSAYDALNDRVDDSTLSLRRRLREHILNVMKSAKVFSKIDSKIDFDFSTSSAIISSSDENKSIVLRTF